MRAILLWTIISLLMILHFFLLLSVGVITTQVRSALDLSALELSFLSSSYLYIYILLQTPAGILLDCYGAKKLLAVGALVCSVGCWIFAHSTDLALGMVGRALTGGGLSFVFVSSVQLANRWFPERYFGMMVGFAETAGMIGAIVSNMLLAIFIDNIGWRDSFEFAGFFAIILALGCWFIISDYPKSVVPKAKQKLTLTRIKLNFQYIIHEPQVWLNSAYVFLMYVAITVFSGLWANPFLRRAYDISLEQATFASCLVLAGIGIGSPLVGALFETTQKRALIMQVCPLAMLLFMCIVLYVPLPSYTLICVSMFLMGFAGSSLIQSFAIVSELAPDGVKSTSVGFTNSLCLISAVLFQPVIGWILNTLSNEVGADGLEYYSALQYKIALTVLPCLVALAWWVGVLIARQLIRSTHIPIESPAPADK